MKKIFSLKTRFLRFGAIFLIAAFAFTSCGSPSGGGSGDEFPYGGDINGYPAGPGGQGQGGPGGQGQGGSGGQGQAGNQGGQQQGPGGGGYTSDVSLTNTTWLFEKLEQEDNYCTDEHKTGSSSDDDVENTNVQTLTTIEEWTEDKNETVNNETKTKYYMHIDKDNKVYVGTMLWKESYTRSVKVKKERLSDGSVYSTEIEGTEKITKTNTGNKVYRPFAIGRLEKDSDLSFTFDYTNNNEEAPKFSNSGSNSSYYPYADPYDVSAQTSDNSADFPEIVKRFLTIYRDTENTKNDKLHYMGLLNPRGYVVATKNGSTLKLEYNEAESRCEQLTPEGYPCGNVFYNKQYSVWSATELKEEMLHVAELVKDETLLKDKEFVEFFDEYIVKDTEYNQPIIPVYDYFKFGADTVLRSSVNYLGNGYFCVNDPSTTNYSDNPENTYVISKDNGKYFLATYIYTKNYNKNAGGFTYTVYDFTAEEGKEPDFNKFNYSDSSYVVNDKFIKAADLIYDNPDFFGQNEYQDQPDFVDGKEWYKQVAVWKDANGNKFECTGITTWEYYEERKGMQEYELTLGDASGEVQNIAALSEDNYLILLDEKSVLLKDNKDQTIEITDGENKYTLTYDSRFGYAEDTGSGDE